MLLIIPLPYSLYLPQTAITPKKNTTSNPNAPLVPYPNAVKAAMTKISPTLDVRSTIFNPSDQDPRTILVTLPISLHYYFNMLLIIPLPYYIYLPQTATKPKKNTTSTPNSSLVPYPNAVKAAMTKLSPTLDVSSTILNTSDQDPRTILVTLSRNTTIPDVTNAPVDKTEEFKTIIYDITDSPPYLIAPISH